MHAAAREIALALGVPPMLRRGVATLCVDASPATTPSRTTRKPTAPSGATPSSRRCGASQAAKPTRTARALADWLSPAYDSALTLRPDLDQIEALAPEREALWTSLEKASFLTADEKRAAAGYGPKPLTKFNPNHAGDGRFDFSPDGGDVHLVGGRGGRGRGRIPSSPAQETRLALADARAKTALRQVAERDPAWQATPQVTDPNSIEGAISAREATAAEAEAKLAELLRGVAPGTNPDWGVNRLEKELRDRGYVYTDPTKAPGNIFTNEATGEQLRIMEKPPRAYRDDLPQKHLNDYYYRYRGSRNDPYGDAVTIPNKK